MKIALTGKSDSYIEIISYGIVFYIIPHAFYFEKKKYDNPKNYRVIIYTGFNFGFWKFEITYRKA